jgi:ribonuclease E
MKKKIIIDAHFPTEIRVALLDKNDNIEHTEFSTSNKKQIKGNIYLAKITRIEPALQAAFVDYGEDKSGFLPFSEIHPDYYHVLSKTNEDGAVIGEALHSSDITDDDFANAKPNTKFHQLAESEEIDIDTVTKMVEEKAGSNINIEAEDDEIEHIQKGASTLDHQYKIQEVIKKGQILLVQATKEERGNKGASLTTYISLAGRYCVLIPNKPSHNGISKKISNGEERKRLKKIIEDLTSTGSEKSSLIIRTAGAGHSTLAIKRDYNYLTKLWNKIREVTLQSKAPAFIHQEDSILLKTIRDVFDSNVKEIVVQGQQAFNTCVKFISDMSPDEKHLIKEYKNKVPIFTKFGIEEQLMKLYQPIVHLPSGGYIVINPTEALISIDVNSGKATGERNIENMALKTNLEAAREIAKQSNLRDLSGLIVIDFIDLSETKNRKILERSLWEFFSKDKARIQISTISNFGLLEMSRQRLRPSFLEMNSSMCLHCSGKGIVRADESNAMLILRTIENEIHNSNLSAVNVYGIASSILYLLNNKRTEIAFIEKKHSIKLNFFIDKDATSDSYSIEKIKAPEKKSSHVQSSAPVIQDTSNIYSDSEEETVIKTGKRKIEKRKDKSRRERQKDSKEQLEAKIESPAEEKKEETQKQQEPQQRTEEKTEEKKKDSAGKKRISRRKSPRKPKAKDSGNSKE